MLEGLQVVGLARRVEMIQEIADQLIDKSGKLYARKCDVTIPEEIILNFKWIKDTLGPVHILINNAGYIKAESILEGNPSTWKTIMDTHLLASTLCSKEAIAQMRESNIAGHVILMNGILGHRITEQRLPIMNIYPCAKYGLTALQELLTQELRYFGTKIKISTMSPGLVHKTEIFVNGNITFLKPELCEKFPHLLPEDVTNGIVYMLSTPPHVQVYELILKPVGELF
ncbi:Antennal dehydrogenase [Carabus blaptoides fortunei]